jgi:hypothetical protein
MGVFACCTWCGRIYEHTVDDWGKTVRCPACLQDTQVPPLLDEIRIECACGDSLKIGRQSIGGVVHCPSCSMEWHPSHELFIDERHPARCTDAEIAEGRVSTDRGNRDMILGGAMLLFGVAVGVTVLLVGFILEDPPPLEGLHVLQIFTVVGGGMFFRGWYRRRLRR